MKQPAIYLCIISLCASSFCFSQEMIKKDTIIKPQRAKSIFLAVDFLNPVLSAFSDKKGAQGMVTYRFYKKFHAVVEAGFEKNAYTKNGWDVEANGPFVRIGANYFFSEDPTHKDNGFYTGVRIGYATYTQKINSFVVRSYDGSTNATGSFPDAKVSAYWAELVLGARVQIGTSRFYADGSVRPKFILSSQKQDDVEVLVVPGFGKSINSINFGLFWGIAYQFPFTKP